MDWTFVEIVDRVNVLTVLDEVRTEAAATDALGGSTAGCCRGVLVFWRVPLALAAWAGDVS